MASSPDLPGTLNLAIRSGDELGKTLTYSLDLTGYTVRTVIYSLVSGSDISTVTTTVTPGSSLSAVGFSVQEADTTALPAGTYGWRQELVAPGNVQSTRVIGTLEIV